MKKLSFQRIFSFLLACAMVLSFVPVQTRAAGFDTVNFKAAYW